MAVHAREEAAAAAQQESEVELTQANASYKTATEDTACIVDAGAALVASLVDDVRMRRTIVGRLFAIASPSHLR